jgi:hypothetical protein
MINFAWVERYVERGFACHWLHGKAPYQKDWSTLPVATLEELKRSYFPGNNLGVRVGQWSRLSGDMGLVILDIDLTRPCTKCRVLQGCRRAPWALLGKCGKWKGAGRSHLSQLSLGEVAEQGCYDCGSGGRV